MEINKTFSICHLSLQNETQTVQFHVQSRFKKRANVNIWNHWNTILHKQFPNVFVGVSIQFPPDVVIYPLGIKTGADHVVVLFTPDHRASFCKFNSRVPKKSHHEQTSVQSWQVEILLCLLIYYCAVTYV